MTQDNLIKLTQPAAFSDLLTDVLRNGARGLATRNVFLQLATRILRCMRTQSGSEAAQSRTRPAFASPSMTTGTDGGTLNLRKTSR